MMASFRCTVLTSPLKVLVRNYSSRLLSPGAKVHDIASRYQFHKGNGRLLSSQNVLSGFLVRANNLQQSYLLTSRLSKTFVPESAGTRHFCTDKPSNSNISPKDSDKSKQDDEASLSVFQRFKKTYKEHGKILIIVHCATSVVWFGSFYMAAVSGVDIVPWMEQMGFSETIIKPFRAGGLGFVALAYLMYKLATPARYTVTLGGTNMAIRYLRRTGKMEPIPHGHSIRNLYKEGKTELRDRQLSFQQRRRTAKIRKERIARHKKS